MSRDEIIDLLDALDGVMAKLSALAMMLSKHSDIASHDRFGLYLLITNEENEIRAVYDQLDAVR